MTMKNDIHSLNSHSQRNDFNAQWKHRQQWKEQAEMSVPDDDTFIKWAEKARQNASDEEINITASPIHPNRRWIPYVAAASVIIGTSVIGLTRQGQRDNSLPVAKDITVEGQTIHFLCNNGCSPQDIILSAYEVIK